MEKNLKNLSNDKLIEMIRILDTNHEKIKFEMIVLNEMLNTIHQDYIEITNELNSRI